MGFIIIGLVLIGIYFLFRELKKDYENELKCIKDEHNKS